MNAVGKYYDGMRANSHAVVITLTSYKLVIEDRENGIKLSWEFSDITLIESPEFGSAFSLSNKTRPAERLIIADLDLYKALIIQIPLANKPLVRVNITKSRGCLLVALFISLMIVYAWVLPQFSSQIARVFPSSWAKYIGERHVETYEEKGLVCKNTDGIESLNKIIKRIVPKEHRDKINVQIVTEDTVNAYIVPGGHVVIFSALLDEAESPEEIAGILAHEVGHHLENHPVQALIERVGVAVILSGMEMNLLNFKYSRDKEVKADRIAISLLDEARVSKRGLIGFLKRNSGSIFDNKIVNYLSTHPANEERISSLVVSNTVNKPTPILSKSEWIQLKQICSKPGV